MNQLIEEIYNLVKIELIEVQKDPIYQNLSLREQSVIATNRVQEIFIGINQSMENYNRKIKGN